MLGLKLVEKGSLYGLAVLELPACIGSAQAMLCGSQAIAACEADSSSTTQVSWLSTTKNSSVLGALSAGLHSPEALPQSLSDTATMHSMVK
jgi:hypothetical protein